MPWEVRRLPLPCQWELLETFLRKRVQARRQSPSQLSAFTIQQGNQFLALSSLIFFAFFRGLEAGLRDLCWGFDAGSAGFSISFSLLPGVPFVSGVFSGNFDVGLAILAGIYVTCHTHTTDASRP